MATKPDSQPPCCALLGPTWMLPDSRKPGADMQPRYPARPYWEDASEANKANAESTQKGIGLFHRRKKVAWPGLLSMLFYMCSLGFYLWVRIAKTLDLGPYL